MFKIMEEFKLFDEIFKADFRSEFCGHGSLKRHYSRIDEYVMHKGVPDSIRGYFATAKNILLYTWLSFDLYPVAELHVLITLEMALRERIGEDGMAEIRLRDKKKGRGTGMQSYIKYAICQGWVKNEDFSAWHRAPLNQALHEQRVKAVELMKERGVDGIDLNEVELLIPKENNFDFLSTLTNWTNQARNGHAHGSGYLYPAEVWNNFEMVTEFINVLFPVPENCN